MAAPTSKESGCHAVSDSSRARLLGVLLSRVDLANDARRPGHMRAHRRVGGLRVRLPRTRRSSGAPLAARRPARRRCALASSRMCGCSRGPTGPSSQAQEREAHAAAQCWAEWGLRSRHLQRVCRHCLRLATRVQRDPCRQAAAGVDLSRTRCFSQQLRKEAWQRIGSPQNTHTARAHLPVAESASAGLRGACRPASAFLEFCGRTGHSGP